MYTHRSLRYATRWNRRLVFALAMLLLLAISWASYHAWYQSRSPVPMGKLV
jgi:hypothetical protein